MSDGARSDLHQQVRLLAMVRIGLGVGFVLAPGPLLRVWLGRGAASPAVKLTARCLGGRDIALGLGTLLALRHGAPLRGWLEAGMLADSCDAAATLAAFPSLPKLGALGAVASAATAAALGRRLVAGLEGSQPAVG
jgi:hypothetical protein